MKRYFVKTRNWNGKKNIHTWLALSQKWGARLVDTHTDSKFYVEATLPLAVLTWLYYKALQPWSDGMVIWQAVKTLNLGGDMKDLTPEQRNALKITEYILGDKGDFLDEDISEAVIIGYNVEGKK